MIVLPVRSFRWRVRNARVLGAGSALALFIGVKVVAAPPADGLGVMAVVLPALEVSIVMGIFAAYRDSFADVTRWRREGAALAGWFAACLVVMWFNAAVVQAGMEAQVRFGLPPTFNFSL